MSVRFFGFCLIFFPLQWALAGEDRHAHQQNSQLRSDAHEHHHDHIGEMVTEAHVHGEVMLQLALQGKNLMMTLQSPAVNLVGFEQRADTPERIKRVEEAEARLLQVAKWLNFDGGECRAAQVTADFSSVLPKLRTAKGDHGHADVHLETQFTCGQPDKLHGLQLNLFRDFPGVEKVTVQWVFETGAGEGELTPEKMDLAFNH